MVELTSHERREVTRFYKTVSIEPSRGGYILYLDGRKAKTPRKNAFVMATNAMAACVVQEWQDQAELIDFQTMPISCRLMALSDRAEEDLQRWRLTVLRYIETDLLCYRAAHPVELVARQTRIWTPLFDWAQAELGGGLVTTSGLATVTPSGDTIEALKGVLDTLAFYELFCLADYAELTGSTILGLALVKGIITDEAAFEASVLDETYQAERWGRDDEADDRLQRLAHTLKQTWRFQKLFTEEAIKERN